MHRVTMVETLPDYRIGVAFSDGTAGVIDLSDMVGTGIFEALKDPSQFAKAYVDSVTHTVAWPGGIDLCPDALYRDVVAQQKAA